MKWRRGGSEMEGEVYKEKLREASFLKKRSKKTLSIRGALSCGGALRSNSPKVFCFFFSKRMLPTSLNLLISSILSPGGHLWTAENGLRMGRNQENFCRFLVGELTPHGALGNRSLIDKSFLVLFFQKRTLTLTCSSATTPPARRSRAGRRTNDRPSRLS